jgi:hypothetical protein
MEIIVHTFENINDAAGTTSEMQSMIKVNFQLKMNDTGKTERPAKNTKSNNKNSSPMPCSIFTMLL